MKNRFSKIWITLFLIGLLSQTSLADTKPQLLDRVVAVVNDDIILKSDLEKGLVKAMQELRSRNIQLTDKEDLAEKVLDGLILERIQLQRSQQLGLKVRDDELFQQVLAIAKQNNLSAAELRDQLNKSKPNGFETFREGIRQELLFKKLRDSEVLSKTQVTESEVTNFIQRQALMQNYSEFKLNHIMISLPKSATPAEREASREKAQKLLTRLKQGEAFSQLAVRHSDGQNALQGGDLGWLKADQLPSFFMDEIDKMAVGDISRVIRSAVGFHIIQLQDKRDKDAKIVKQYHLYRFILLSDNAQQTQTPNATLIKLAKGINSLEDFKALNDKYKDMPTSVNANSHLGWQTLAEMPQDYIKAIKDLSPKQAAMPFANDQGWVILYLDGIRDKDLSIINKRQEAMQSLRMKKATESYGSWLRRMKDEAIIDIRLKDADILSPQKAF